MTIDLSTLRQMGLEDVAVDGRVIVMMVDEITKLREAVSGIRKIREDLEEKTTCPKCGKLYHAQGCNECAKCGHEWDEGAAATCS